MNGIRSVILLYVFELSKCAFPFSFLLLSIFLYSVWCEMCFHKTILKYEHRTSRRCGTKINNKAKKLSSVAWVVLFSFNFFFLFQKISFRHLLLKYYTFRLWCFHNIKSKYACYTWIQSCCLIYGCYVCSPNAYRVYNTQNIKYWYETLTEKIRGKLFDNPSA